MNEEQMLALMRGVEALRENISALVVGLRADGFTDTQARWIVVGVFTQHLHDEEANEED